MRRGEGGEGGVMGWVQIEDGRTGENERNLFIAGGLCGTDSK